MNIPNKIADYFSKAKPLAAGVHHLRASVDEKPYRLHLRLNQDGSGILIVNAATILQLNPSAAEYAFHFIKGSPASEAARQVAKRYQVSEKTALMDFENFCEQIHTLVSTPDLDPTTSLNFERVAPHSCGTPLRLDCALTYRLPEGSEAILAPVKRVERELDTAAWKGILDKAWQAGIPHVVFTGGEATLRADLPALIAHAEKNGQVCGLLTDGIKLIDSSYLDLLLQTGLDHILLILQAEEPQCWEAVRAVVAQDIFLTVHLTLTPENRQKGREILEKAAALGVKNVSLSASHPSLEEDVRLLQNAAIMLNLSLRWDLPVPYSAANPVALETVDDEIPSGAGKAWLYVEPDGDLLPAQGEPDKILGNLARDNWDTIFQVAVA